MSCKKVRDGNLVGSVDLPRGGYQIALSEGDHFVLFGLAGQDVWRVQLSAAGIIEADEVIYSGSALSTFLTLKQFGDIAQIRPIPFGVQRRWFDVPYGNFSISP